MKKIDVNSYVIDRLEREGIKNEDSQESFRKQVINVLNYFEFAHNIDLFRDIRTKKDERAKHIFACFPFHFLTNKDKIKFLDFIFDKKHHESPKFVANINKIHIDNKVDKENTFTHDNRERDFKKEFDIKEADSQHKLEIQNLLHINRHIVRKGGLFSKDVNIGINKVTKSLKDERLYFNISHAVDIVSDLCLQILNYWIISMNGLTEKDVDYLLESLRNYMIYFEKTNIHVIFDNEANESIKYEDAVGIYAAFLERRNNYGQYLDIIRVLTEEANAEPSNFANPPDDYKVTKNMPLPQDVKIFLTEGQPIDNFRKKFENTKALIDIFSKYGGRNASIDNIMDLKVYFREFYFSDIGYKKQAQTIVRKYIEKYEDCNDVDSFEKLSEYQFIREKLNRGYFRETIGIERYNKKNEMQEILYTYLLRIFLLYDYDLIIESLANFALGYVETYRSCIRTMVKE